MARIIAYISILIWVLIGHAGCALKWQSGLQEAMDDDPTARSKQLLAEAHTLYEQADNAEALTKSISAYQTVLSHNGGDYQALVQMSNLYILKGTAYTRSRNEKSAFFKKAMRTAELAMLSNPQFKEVVRNGSTPWEAVNALGKRETEAMFFWVTALQYEFKEGMTLAGKMRNVDWLRRGLLFLDRIEDVNPGFGGGAVEFAKAICYYVLPKSKGGSKEKGEKYVQKAVARGEKRLLPRWGRGKYFYKIKGEDEKSREDLAWVLAQNIDAFDDPYPWKIHFQQDAKKLIK